MSETTRIEIITGEDVRAYVPALARLRIEVFREYPYLYEGDPDYEERYLQKYVDAPGAVIVLVFAGGHVVGASTALPLIHADKEFQRPFLEHGYPPEAIYYLGESVLLAPYRGRGLGGQFFDTREARARQLGGFRWTAFCAVERPPNHPLRPWDYRPLHGFWERHGYQRHPELMTYYAWRDIGDDTETRKPMMFWLKALEPAAA